MIFDFGSPAVPFNNPAFNQHLVQRGSGLADDEIQRICAIGDALESTNVKLYGRFDDSRVKASGSHFPLNDETRWLYERMAQVVHETNAAHFRYDLSGFFENFYYLRYGPGEHFNWHLDMGAQTPAPRKLSLILQLSDPSEYDGGDFDVLVALDHERAEKRKGDVMVFSAYKPHRVTPITRGTRRSLAMFAAGPAFR